MSRAMSPALAAKAASRRSTSRARLRATWMSQAEGLAGTPVCGHCWMAFSSTSCTTSSASDRWRGPRMRVEVRNHPAELAAEEMVNEPGHIFSTRRTSMASKMQMGAVAAKFDRVFIGLGGNQEIAAEYILRFGVRAIGDVEFAGSGAQHAAAVVFQFVAAENAAGVAEFLAPGAVAPKDGLHLFGA